jgi:hypothetical protein
MLPGTWSRRALPVLSCQSSESTSRLGRHAEENDAQSRPGAECESDHFPFEINAHSEKLAKLTSFNINSLPTRSECDAL